jgi:hypothetical protein
MEDTMKEWTNAKLCDVGNLVIGIVLFFTPWIFGYPAGAETTNAFVVGIVIAVISIAALAAYAVWEEWLNLIAGLWLIVSPWVLGFPASTAMRVDVVIGIVVAALAIVEMWVTTQTPRHEPSPR